MSKSAGQRGTARTTVIARHKTMTARRSIFSDGVRRGQLMASTQTRTKARARARAKVMTNVMTNVMAKVMAIAIERQ